MTNFFRGLKDLFDRIPSKTKFLTDIGFNNSYIGFRYFLQGRNDKPSTKFMEQLCEEVGYDYIRVPVKPGTDQEEIRDKLYEEFTSDLEEYLKKYEGDPARTYTKNKAGESSVSAAVAAFEVEQDLLDPNKQLDVSDLF